MSKFQRKKLFIDRQVQMALVRRLVGHWLCFIAVAIFLATLFQFLAEDPFQDFTELMSSVAQRNGLFIFILIVIVPVFILDTIKLSHRFAGPILRLRRALSELADGKDMEPLKFREKDFWGELASDFNRVLEEVKEHRQTQADGSIETPETSDQKQLVSSAD